MGHRTVSSNPLRLGLLLFWLFFTAHLVACGFLLSGGIAPGLQPRIHLPGDRVIQRGAWGEEMYFVSHGHLEVLADDDRSPVAHLREGSWFGEMSLLWGGPRSATRTSPGMWRLWQWSDGGTPRTGPLDSRGHS